jgi:hypothetical protein
VSDDRQFLRSASVVRLRVPTNSSPNFVKTEPPWEVAQMILVRSEAGDDFAVQLERGNAVGDAPMGLGLSEECRSEGRLAR